MSTHSQRRNPGWRLDQETLDIVAEARGELALANHEVIARWAMQWKENQSRQKNPVETVAMSLLGVPAEKPMAARVETPYQIERREKLEKLRARMESGEMATEGDSGAFGEGYDPKGSEPMTLPFEVMVNGEKHRVIEFKGRKVLEWVGPSSTVMKANLTQQQVLAYWRDRAKP